MPLLLLLLFLWYRRAQFKKLTLADLPNATAADIEAMQNASKAALRVVLAAGISALLLATIAILSAVYIPEFILIDKSCETMSVVLWLGGLLLGIVYDSKAERIKKRCRAQSH